MTLGKQNNITSTITNNTSENTIVNIEPIPIVIKKSIIHRYFYL